MLVVTCQTRSGGAPSLHPPPLANSIPISIPLFPLELARSMLSPFLTLTNPQFFQPLDRPTDRPTANSFCLLCLSAAAAELSK